MKTLILVNVGTPQAPEPEAVGVYLKEFLMDENILHIPRPFRDLLVKGVIVPRRKHSSAEKYNSIWTDQGSPLMVESLSLQKQLQSRLGTEWQVLLGMQVGEPSLKKTLEIAKSQSDEIHVLPLYPQYAQATTGGTLQVLKTQDKSPLPTSTSLQWMRPFYQEKWFIQAQAARIRESLKPQDHLLLSYHGLPVSHLKKHNPQCYGQAHCCQLESSCATNCYKAQCLKTSELLKKELNLQDVSVGFQSRLGRGQWIEPATQDLVKELASKGIRNLKVACPSFVLDCLETLEEIGLELKKEFLDAGGESFELIECINSHEIFVSGLVEALQDHRMKVPVKAE